MNVKQSDIVLLSVPFSDQSSRKVRPAIIISNDSINNASEDIILIPITSVIKETPYSIMITQKNLVEGKLATPSRARIDKIFTVHKSLIKMKIGIINKETLEGIKKELIKIM